MVYRAYMKRIGILTYFWGVNPGSVLQAYSTLTLLKRLKPECEVEMIHYQPSKKSMGYAWNYFNLPFTMYKLKVLDLHRKYKLFRKNELDINQPSLVTKDYELAIKFIQERYDVIIVGSDTVWEIDALARKDLAAFPNIYWLSPDLKALKIAFSVSMGASSIEEIEPTIQDQIYVLVNGFDRIGVRDDVTEKAIKKILSGYDDFVVRTPDPTFSYKIRRTDVKRKLLKSGLDLYKPIAGVCLPGIKIRKQIISYLLKQGYQVLLMNHIPEFKLKRANNVFVLPALTPHEWAESFRFLSIAFTQLFHGTIFSLKNRTPVISIDCQSHRFTSSGESKTLSILKEFGMSEYAHLNVNDVETDFSRVERSIHQTIKRFDKDDVNTKLSDMRNRCAEFLKEAIV